MDDYKIPIIEPTIDYTKVPPINQKRTISFINHFIIHTVTFLNKFALSCEEKLFEFENKLQRVEASLEILESRLSSIPDLEQGVKSQANVTKEDNKDKEYIEKPLEKPELPKEPEPDVKVDNNDTKSEETEVQNVEKDPRYEKYFKMVHFGVPKQAVQLKMVQEGLDPSILDGPQGVVSKLKSGSNIENQGD